MNERIKELAEQAGCAWWEGRAMRDMTRCQCELEKFAELIVEECINRAAGCSLVVDSNKVIADEFELGYIKGVSKVVSQLKLHFGIKE